MRSSSIFSLLLTTLTALSVVSAGSGNMHNNRLNRRGHDAAVAERRLTNHKVKVLRKKDGSKKNKKRGGRTCRVKGTGSASAAAGWNATATATASGSASVTLAPSSTAWSSSAAPSATYSSSSQAWNQWSSSSSSAPAPSSTQVWWTSSSSEAATSTTSSAPQPSATYTPPTGVISASGACGDSGASADHPNGSPEWLNCKLTEGGWVPPNLSASQLISISDPGLYPEVFGACLNYKDIFANAAGEKNMPAALLMAIGMQESGCNKGAVGSRGEQGIMQVAGNACDNQSGDCQEPWYNIHKGASILVEKMGGDPNGNIIEALGMYNGWMPGMQAGWGAEYGPQGQKISYLDDMLNKWLQGKNGH